MRRTLIPLWIALLLCPLPAPASQPTTRPSAPALIPSVEFNGVSLADALGALRDASGANFNINWPALEKAGIGKDLPVKLKLTNVTFRAALTQLLSTATGNKADFSADDNLIEITTREILDKRLVTRVYDVRDQLVEVPDFHGPDFNLQSASTSFRRGGAGGSLISSSSRDSDKGRTVQERADDLVHTITTTIQPDIWKENGGPATIRYFNGHLIITAPRTVHAGFTGLFQQRNP